MKPQSRLALVGVLALLVLSSLAEAAPYAFTKIAEFADSTGRVRIPSINQDGVVAFEVTRDGVREIYIGDGSALTRLLILEPTNSDAAPIINDAGDVAFGGRPPADTEGIYIWRSGALIPVATTAGPLAGFYGLSFNNSGAVAFTAHHDSGELTLFVGDGSAVQPVVSQPGIVVNLFWEPYLDDQGVVLFVGQDAAGDGGIFVSDGGVISQVVFSADRFRYFNYPAMNQLGTIVFHAHQFDSLKGLFASTAGTITAVPDPPTAYTDIIGAPAINNAGTIAFAVRMVGGGEGIFTGPDPSADRVIATDDPLLGSQVSFVAFGRDGLNQAGQITFWAQLKDGRRGVFRADQMRRLTIETAGRGSLTVTSAPAGIDCGATCSAYFPPDTVVTLSRVLAADTRFLRWSGAADCTDGVVTMTTDVTCVANIELNIDLKVTALNKPPATAVAGTNLSVTDTVKNTGTAVAEASTNRYYLSKDKKRGAGDRRLIGTRSVPSLNPGAVSRKTVSVGIPATMPPGSYWLLSCADDTTLVVEANEKNNCKVSTSKVTVTAP